MRFPHPSLKSLFVFALLTLAGLLTLGQPAAYAQKTDRPFGDVQVLAHVPQPGLPEGIAVNGDRVYVAGPASFDTAGAPPSYVIAYDTRTGETLRTYTIQGEYLAAPHANSCIAFDGQGRLYVVNIQFGIIRIDLGSGQQEVYASTLPNLAPCSPSQSAPCSPTPIDLPPLANDIAFDAAGNLYLTDSFQATIWRIPAGGGQPQIWFQDAALATNFGANGLRLSPDGSRIFFSVTSDASPFSPAFTGGRIYSLPLVDQPTSADLQLFHQYNGEAPDGIVFGRSGKLYVMLAIPGFSGISILRPDGTEETQLHNAPGSPFFPYDSPANGAFDKHGSLLLSNHAFATLNPANFTVLSVFVDDKEAPLVRPNIQ